MALPKFRQILAALAMGGIALAPSQALAEDYKALFDRTFGTEIRPPSQAQVTYSSPLEQRIALLADGSKGRIGVAAIDLKTGEQISILGDQRFPLASTSKIAIAATFLEGVDQGRWSLDDKFPLLEKMPSKKLSGTPVPMREGKEYSARDLIEMMITRSHNPATDGLLHVVGGPKAVNDWARRSGIEEFHIDRYIATLVRDDGEFDPESHIDTRDSATPLAMARMLKGLHEGKWLSTDSRAVLMGAMERCMTGKTRIPGQLPEDVQVAHKTGSLYNTSSDVGIITGPDGHAIAIAVYVTGGKMNKSYRYDRIATIARAVYDGYTSDGRVWVNASYSAPSP